MDIPEELRVCGGYDFLPFPDESIEDCRKRIKERIKKEREEGNWAKPAGFDEEVEDMLKDFDEWLEVHEMK